MCCRRRQNYSYTTTQTQRGSHYSHHTKNRAIYTTTPQPQPQFQQPPSQQPHFSQNYYQALDSHKNYFHKISGPCTNYIHNVKSQLDKIDRAGAIIEEKISGKRHLELNDYDEGYDPSH